MFFRPKAPLNFGEQLEQIFHNPQHWFTKTYGSSIDFHINRGVKGPDQKIIDAIAKLNSLSIQLQTGKIDPLVFDKLKKAANDPNMIKMDLEFAAKARAEAFKLLQEKIKLLNYFHANIPFGVFYEEGKKHYPDLLAKDDLNSTLQIYKEIYVKFQWKSGKYFNTNSFQQEEKRELLNTYKKYEELYGFELLSVRKNEYVSLYDTLKLNFAAEAHAAPLKLVNIRSNVREMLNEQQDTLIEDKGTIINLSILYDIKIKKIENSIFQTWKTDAYLNTERDARMILKNLASSVQNKLSNNKYSSKIKSRKLLELEFYETLLKNDVENSTTTNNALKDQWNNLFNKNDKYEILRKGKNFTYLYHRIIASGPNPQQNLETKPTKKISEKKDRTPANDLHIGTVVNFDDKIEEKKEKIPANDSNSNTAQHFDNNTPKNTDNNKKTRFGR